MSSVTTSTTTCSSSAIRGTRGDSTNVPQLSTIMRGRRRTNGSIGLQWPVDVGGLTGHGRTGVGDGYEYPICSHRSTLALLISNPSIRPGATLDLSRYTAFGLQVGPIQSNELSKKAPRCREALVSIWEKEYSPQHIADRYGGQSHKSTGTRRYLRCVYPRRPVRFAFQISIRSASSSFSSSRRRS